MKIHGRPLQELTKRGLKTRYITASYYDLYGPKQVLAPNEEREFCRNILFPMAQLCTRTVANVWDAAAFNELREGGYVRAEGRLSVLTPRAFEFPDADVLWVGTIGRRPTVTFFFEGTDALPEALMAKLADPTLIANLQSVASRSAVIKAREWTNSGSGRWAMLLPSNTRVDFVCVFLSGPKCAELGTVLEECRISEQYNKLFLSV